MTLVAAAAADTTTSTGTGAVTLSGTAQAITINGIPATTFAVGFTLGGTVAYPISNIGYQISDGTNTETGTGTLTSATNLTRDLIVSSSNGGRHVNFIAGTKTVTSVTTAWNSSEPSWTSVPPTTLPENDIQSGTFVATLTQSGLTTPGTVRYKVSGSGEVVLSFPVLTQNTTGTAITITGIPASLSPTAKSVIGLVTSSGTIVLGLYSIAPAATVQGTGTITLQQSTGTSPIAFTGVFTASVVNGVPATDIAYNLF